MPAHVSTLLCHLRKLTSPTASDAALLMRWRDRRDEAAFADLVARHGPMVLGVCRRVLGDVQHAEDAFQATFLVLARKAADLRRPESLPGFLHGVALRLARKAQRTAHRRMVQPHPNAPEPADPHPDPLDALSGRELLALLDEEITRLPDVYRLPLLLCVLQERPAEEAARMLGWSVGSVRGRLARARQRLRERLARRGLCLSAGMVALLAPAAVPKRLLAETVCRLAAPAPAAISALVAGPAPALKMRAACLVLLLVAAGLGVGLSFLRAPRPEPASTATPAAPARAKDEPRRDRHGDPLPPGAIARLGTVRFRVAGQIEELALAPDGKTVAASSWAGVFLFDAISGKRIQSLPASELTEFLRAKPLVFSPDGKRLAGRLNVPVGDRSQFKSVVRVWELGGERKPRDYDAENVLWVGWSADREPLAVCLEKGALRLAELAAGRSRRFVCEGLPTPEQLNHTVRACTAIGKTLAVANAKRDLIHVWDTDSGKERCTLRLEQGDNACSLALSSDGSKLLCGITKAVQMWDVATRKMLYTVKSEITYPFPVFTADGKRFAVADSYDTICFRESATGRELGRMRDKRLFGTSLGLSFGFSSDGKTLATAEYPTGAIHLFDVATGKRKPAAEGQRGRPHGAFSPDGQRLVTGGSQDGTIHVWNLATSESLLHIDRSPHRLRSVAFSADGRSVFSAWEDKDLWISDAATGERRHVIKLEDPERPGTYQEARTMQFSTDSKRLVAFSFYNGGPRYDELLITGWDAATHKQLFRRRLPGRESKTALSADARVLAAARLDYALEPRPVLSAGPMRLENVATGERLLTFPALEGQTWPQAFSPDGRLLAANNYNYERSTKKGKPADTAPDTLRLWEIATAAELLKLPVASNNQPAFSADGRLLAVAAPSQEILIWDLARGREHRRFKGFDAQVTWLAFSPDGRRLISGLSDSTLLVWDVGLRGTTPETRLGAERLAKAWADLAGADAPRAFRAGWRLASSPEEVVRFLKGKLRRAEAADPQRLRRLLADLANTRFAVRAKAQAELEELDDLAVPALRQALANKPTLEARQRVQAVLDRLRGPVTRPELLCSLRAVAVLEDIATPDARKLLEGLACGAPEARLTREAKAALNSLVRRTTAPR